MSESNVTQIPRAGGTDVEVRHIVTEFDKQTSKYDGILPSNVKLADFRNAFLTAVQGNPKLLLADRRSLWLALQKAASDGLKPDGREGALVIFGDDEEDDEGNTTPSRARGQKKVVWMPMVWGLTKVMRNTGNIASVRAKVIYRGEKVHVIDEDGRESYRHERVIGGSIEETDENIIGSYAVVQYKDGSWDAEFVSRMQIERVRSLSRAKKGPWKTHFSQMCVKVPLRRLSLRVEKSAENERYFTSIQDDERTIDGTVDEQQSGQQSAITHQQPDPSLDEFMPRTDRDREPVVMAPTKPTEQRVAQAPATTAPENMGNQQREPTRTERRQAPAPWWDGLDLKGRALSIAQNAPIRTLDEARGHNWMSEPGAGERTRDQIVAALGLPVPTDDEPAKPKAAAPAPKPLPAVSPATAKIITSTDDEDESPFGFGDPE